MWCGKVFFFQNFVGVRAVQLKVIDHVTSARKSEIVCPIMRNRELVSHNGG